MENPRVKELLKTTDNLNIIDKDKRANYLTVKNDVTKKPVHKQAEERAQVEQTDDQNRTQTMLINHQRSITKAKNLELRKKEL